MPEGIVRRVLRLVGYEVNGHEFDEEASTLTLWVGPSAADPYHCCRSCGISTREVHDAKERRVRDLPWGEWKVWLIVMVHRVRCRRWGVTTEAIPFLEGKQPYTRRFAEAVARECEDAPVNRVAARWGDPPGFPERNAALGRRSRQLRGAGSHWSAS